MSNKPYRRTICIIRAQMLHIGHLHLIDEAIALGDNTLVLVGSAYQSRKPRNPFRYAERVEMIAKIYNGIEIRPLIDDLYDNGAWIEQVQHTVEEVIEHDQEENEFVVSPSTVALVGHRKADTMYLDWFPQWDLVEVSEGSDIDATTIRDAFYNEGKILEEYLHPTTLEFIKNSKEFVEMRAEHLFNLKYKESTKHLQYEPIYQTVDAVVVCNGHVLMVKRRAIPGKGLWALPGGYLNANERIVDGILRELREETGFKASRSDIKLIDWFDHPARSARGRLITHAGLIVINHQKKLPKVKGADDAEKAKWIPFSEFSKFEMMESIFEDHGSIISRLTRKATDFIKDR